MTTANVVARIPLIQAAFSALWYANVNLFPPDTTPQDGAAYDYVVVGGGNAGSVVSARLVEAGFSVLLIEAGGIYGIESRFPGLANYIKNTRADWNYTTEPDGFTNKCQRRGSGPLIPRVLGGLSAVDYVIYARGYPPSFDRLSKRIGDDSWSGSNMVQYYKKLERLRDPTILNSPFGKNFGVDGKVSITRDPNDVCDEYIQGFEEAGEPVPLDNIASGLYGYSRALYYVENGMVQDAAYSYLSPIKDNPLLQLSLNSLASKIIFDDQKNAVGVEFIKKGKKITVKAKNEVIISAGAIKSPQLLMLSGIGPKAELEKWNIPCLSDLPVGRNLQGLISTLLFFKTNKPATEEPTDIRQTISPLVVGYSFIDGEPPEKSAYRTYNRILDNYVGFLIQCGFVFSLDFKICDQIYSKGDNTELLMTILNNLRIKSRGKVYLKSTDPEDSPGILANYYSNNDDLDTIAKQIQDYIKVVSTPYFKDVLGLEFIEPITKCSHLPKGSREYWRCYVLCIRGGFEYFYGTNLIDQVADTKLYVKGVNKLRVVDGSVIDIEVTAATFGPILAIAEKTAELIISAAK